MGSKNFFIVTFSLIALLGISYWANNRDKLILTKSTFKGVDEIDTIEAYPEKGLFILGLVRRYGPYGDYDYNLAFEKNDKQMLSNKLRYEVNTGFHFGISKDYIAIDTIELGKPSFGWFALQDGKILSNLPDMEFIKDSLERASDTSVCVQQGYGYITLYVNGKSIKDLNYGNLRTKHFQLDFDSLDYNLYKIEGDSIVVASKNVDDFFEFQEGIFFIPKPGYGLEYKYDKRAILNYIDSVYDLESVPTKIKFNPVD